MSSRGEDSSRPFWSTTRTASALIPGTEAATRLTIASTWLCDRLRPFTSRTITEALGGLFSRTNTDLSGVAKWTRTDSIPSISRIVSISSRSRAKRRRSPSSVREVPSGIASSIASAPSGAAIPALLATSILAR